MSSNASKGICIIKWLGISVVALALLLFAWMQ